MFDQWHSCTCNCYSSGAAAHPPLWLAAAAVFYWRPSRQAGSSPSSLVSVKPGFSLLWKTSSRGSCHLCTCSSQFCANLDAWRKCPFGGESAEIVLPVCVCLCALVATCLVHKQCCCLGGNSRPCLELDRWNPVMGTVPYDIRRLLKGNSFEFPCTILIY